MTKAHALPADAPVETVKVEVEHKDYLDKLNDDLDGDAPFEIDPAKERALVRKVDLHMMPMLWLMLLMNYIDRTNIGNAKVGGMAAELHMKSADYSLVLSIFYAGYLAFEVPSNMILARTNPRYYLPLLMLAWGAMSCAVKGIHSVAGMAVFRVALGLVEAGFYPGVMLLMSCWYKPNELSRRMTLFYSATLVAGAFGGLLAGGIIEGMEGVGGTPGWKWLFIIEGCATVAVAGFAILVLPNYPATTSWLTDEERSIAVRRLLSEDAETDAEQHVGHLKAMGQAFKDPIMWCMLITYNIINCSGTISYFIPTLTAALGYHGRMSQFMTVPIYAVSLVLSIAGGFIADRTGHKALTIAGAGALACASYVVCTVVSNPKVKYAFICFGAGGVWTCIPVFLSWVVIMFDGREKRAISIAMINGFGNLSSIYGSFFWPSSDAPRYIKGFAITTSLCGFLVVMVLFTKWRFGDKGVRRTA
ncbi:hypothetical protein Q8F55_002991 [Vanrija albida]|uniref:Major facilitator superfamily (MFS) profile domain-containing protein n=1 Tax=Vanrija albida TaxID=181172 RepID=A0ABR3QBC5_9TREE